MIALIENYRGYEINFDTENSKFETAITEDLTKESLSFLAVKKFIDDFIKNNKEFKPFYVEATPTSWKCGKYKIVGIRKDLRFIGEDEKGNKVQISDYDLTDYMILDNKNQELWYKLSELKEKEKEFNEKIKKDRSEIISQMKIVTLKDYKDFNYDK